MSGEPDNVAMLRLAYDKWRQSRGRSIDHWMSLMAPNVTWGSLAEGTSGLEFTSRRIDAAGVRSYFDGMARDWAMVDYIAETFIAQGDQVVMRGRCTFRHRGTGKILDTPKADFFRIRDGKIVSFYEFYDTAMAMRAATPG